MTAGLMPQNCFSSSFWGTERGTARGCASKHAGCLPGQPGGSSNPAKPQFPPRMAIRKMTCKSVPVLGTRGPQGAGGFHEVTPTRSMAQRVLYGPYMLAAVLVVARRGEPSAVGLGRKAQTRKWLPHLQTAKAQPPRSCAGQQLTLSSPTFIFSFFSCRG